MLTKKSQERAAPVFYLQDELTIYRAAELKLLLLGTPRPLNLDLSGVTELDSAGVQLLMQAKKMALQHQESFQLQAPSAAVSEVLALLNLQNYFEVILAGVTHES
jgi:anti-anti-sigma factor